MDALAWGGSEVGIDVEEDGVLAGSNISPFKLSPHELNEVLEKVRLLDLELGRLQFRRIANRLEQNIYFLVLLVLDEVRVL